MAHSSAPSPRQDGHPEQQHGHSTVNRQWHGVRGSADGACDVRPLPHRPHRHHTQHSGAQGEPRAWPVRIAHSGEHNQHASQCRMCRRHPPVPPTCVPHPLIRPSIHPTRAHGQSAGTCHQSRRRPPGQLHQWRPPTPKHAQLPGGPPSQSDSPSPAHHNLPVPTQQCHLPTSQLQLCTLGLPAAHTHPPLVACALSTQKRSAHGNQQQGKESRHTAASVSPRIHLAALKKASELAALARSSATLCICQSSASFSPWFDRQQPTMWYTPRGLLTSGPIIVHKIHTTAQAAAGTGGQHTHNTNQ
jgi:hypothetical protein